MATKSRSDYSLRRCGASLQNSKQPVRRGESVPRKTLRRKLHPMALQLSSPLEGFPVGVMHHRELGEEALGHGQGDGSDGNAAQVERLVGPVGVQSVAGRA